MRYTYEIMLANEGNFVTNVNGDAIEVGNDGVLRIKISNNECHWPTVAAFAAGQWVSYQRCENQQDDNQ